MNVKKQRKAVLLENLSVTEYAAEGKSLAKLNGKVIFIEGAIPGDIVDVLLKKIKRIGQKGLRFAFTSILLSGKLPFVRILGYAEDASGKCYPTHCS